MKYICFFDQVSSNDPKDEEPFSLLGALEEGYFSDLVVKADSGREVIDSIGVHIDVKCTTPFFYVIQ